MKNKIIFPFDEVVWIEENEDRFIIDGMFFDFGEEFYDKFGKVDKVYVDKNNIIQEIKLINGERLKVEWET